MVSAHVRGHAASVRIYGTFNVAKMPRGSTIQIGVLACVGGTSFGVYCGTAVAPAYLALENLTSGSNSAGSYDFGQMPVSASGWQIGLVLFDGASNGGYYPASAPITVAKKGSTATVLRALAMTFVHPEINASFGVSGAPSGYNFIYEAVACPSAATQDQLVVFEAFGACAIAEAIGAPSLPLYVAPGSWTVRIYFAPYEPGVQMVANRAEILAKFDLVGPTVDIPSEASLATTRTTTPYVAPTIAGTVTNDTPAGSDFAGMFYVDTKTNATAVGIYANPQSKSSTSFHAYLSPGTYAPWSEAVPPVHFNQSVSAGFVQVLLHRLAAPLKVDASTADTRAYAIPTYSETVHGSFVIKGLPDPADGYGEDNTVPLSYVIVCPGTSSFSPQCANEILVSPTMMLGGNVNLYDVSGGATMAFTYTTLSGDAVIGPAVKIRATAKLQKVALDAPYRNPSIWGQIHVLGSGVLSDVWLQACPANEQFSLTCAGGTSQMLPGYFNQFSGGATQFGYGIDLAKGPWNLAVAGSTDPRFASDVQLGPTVHVNVGQQYPVIDFWASS